MDSPADVTLVAHSTIRRRIARHMVEASAAAAHAYAMIDVDYSTVAEVRRRRKLSYLPFVTRAVAIGIEQYPYLNGRFTDHGLEVAHEVRMGIAVDLNFQGLIVPVISHAEKLSVPEFAVEIKELAARAHAGKLRNENITGGTVTVSNPGPYGARRTLPIINHPQVAILTVDAVEPRPAVDGDSVVVRPIGNLTLAWDHRAFDGAYATSALAAIRTTLQSHDWETEFEGVPA
ncbi:2-oxo acid dehydrogenase subunit E2 [Lentzea sp. NPDC051838]|uniref:2-oxo acid dehydrogenase subunit E2 n=1 Tax=Lentzea sp. NPDC051838 TaxID=3154849 RepID=UPI0034121DAD